MATHLWKFLQDVAEASAETASQAAGAQQFLDPKLALILKQGHSLLDVLLLPLADLAALPTFTDAVPQWLKFYQEKQGQLPLEETIALCSQAAYLESFRATLSLPKVQGWLEQIGNKPASTAVEQRFRQLAAFEVDQRDARMAIVAFPNSSLATTFNSVLSARLAQLGVKPSAALQIAAQVAQKTEALLLSTLAQVGNTVKYRVEWYQRGGAEKLDRYLSIETYLEEQIQPQVEALVFSEPLTLREMYVPLKGQPFTREGEPDLDQPLVKLEQCVWDWLNDDRRQEHVLFIQSRPGRGKTTFCRMFADQMQSFVPQWIPILVRLRDVKQLEQDVEAVLRQVISYPFAQHPDWLMDENVRFLFLLDGFDELLVGCRTTGGLEEFLHQVGKFQEGCANATQQGHRVLITGRAMPLQNMARIMPPNLERIEILPFDTEQQQAWLTHWQKKFSPAVSLQEFLQDPRLPDYFPDLTGEPLLLYFVAALHRDGEPLSPEQFEGVSQARAKVLIYQQAMHWILAKECFTLVDRPLTPEDLISLHRLFAEAGLCIVQSGEQAIPIAMLEARLKPDESASQLLKAMQITRQQQAYQNTLIRVYSLPEQLEVEMLEFTHRSFGEMLFARRLRDAMEDWATLIDRRHHLEDLIPVDLMHWQIYDLLGYGALTAEIVEYLMVMLSADADRASSGRADSNHTNAAIDLVRLFHRLEAFYLQWCDGNFIDLPPENPPQKKMRLFRELQLGSHLGQRQADIYAGLNSLILLLQLNGYARSHDELQDKISFYPCGRQGALDFDPGRLLRIMGYGYCVTVSALKAIVGPYLSNVNLCGVNLRGAYLSGVNLSSANLRDADLSSADLSGANLTRTYVSGANLVGIDLSSADLRGANLIGANLRGADLSSADLSGADLGGANLIGASLSGANLCDTDLSGSYLRGASFRNADLTRATLLGANLSGAYLRDANLTDATLNGAYLRGADLIDASLSGADLSGVDFVGADLGGADLSSADLSGADLSSADLSEANLGDGDRSSVKWDEATQWQLAQGLDTAIHLPEALKSQITLDE